MSTRYADEKKRGVSRPGCQRLEAREEGNPSNNTPQTNGRKPAAMASAGAQLFGNHAGGMNVGTVGARNAWKKKHMVKRPPVGAAAQPLTN